MVLDRWRRLKLFSSGLRSPGGGAFGADRTSYSLFTVAPTRLSAPPRPSTEGDQRRSPSRAGSFCRSARTPARSAAPARGGGGPEGADGRAGRRRRGRACSRPICGPPSGPGAVWTGPISESVAVLAAQVAENTVQAGSLGPLSVLWKAPGPARPRGADPKAGASHWTRYPPPAVSRQGRQYLIVESLKRAGLQSPNPANEWLRQWSFNASSAPRVVRVPAGLLPDAQPG
jgi:hypothetical protein